MSVAAATAFQSQEFQPAQTSCEGLRIGSDETNRLKGFLGTTAEMTAVADIVAPRSVAWVKSLSDTELLPLGEKALHDIADDILVLDEIRSRFRAAKGAPILGYQNWREFVERNSRYSLRTVQNRLAEKNGKDESKVNHSTGNMYTRTVEPAVKVPVEVLTALEKSNPDVAKRMKAGALAPRPQKTRRTTPAQFQSKDFYHSVGHGLANAFAGVEARLDEIARIRKSDWNPAAAEGVSRLIKNLEQVSNEATAYAAKLKVVLRNNR
jgi:hypothetical protein